VDYRRGLLSVDRTEVTMGSRLDRLIDLASLASGASAVVIAAVVVVRETSAPAPALGNEHPREIPEWERLVDDSHRLGPADALVTIIEFGDYECPGCRAWQPEIEQILSRYGEEVAFIYKHWPLGYHQLAYPAARAAECAGEQGRFWQFHRMLYANTNWIGDALESFARDVGVPDMARFEECVAATELVAAIERDIAQAEDIAAPGTPTIIVNGLMLGMERDAEFLAELIEEAIR
jgi:protein-disulfide isomerase